MAVARGSDLRTPEWVRVLVPLRPDGGERDRLWAHCRPLWERGLRCSLSEGYHLEREGRFNRAAALNRAALGQAPGDDTWTIAVIVDADILIDMDRVADAIVVASYTSGLVLPYTQRRLVTPENTRRVLRGLSLNLAECSRPDRNSEHCSSVQVVPRVLWDLVGGFDERFVGYGGEDEAFVAACSTLGPGVTRLPGDVYHLAHAVSPERAPGEAGFQANWDLAGRYKEAAGDPDAIRAILAERDHDGAGPEEDPNP